jgi:acyl carrier protein
MGSGRNAGAQDLDFEGARSVVARLIVQVAPEVDPESIDFADALHDIADLDSLDFLRLVALTAESTGIVVPPRDYPCLATLDGFARYLVASQSSAAVR